VTALVFVATVAGVAVAWTVAAWRIDGARGAGIAATVQIVWLAITAALALSGRLASFDVLPPPMLFPIVVGGLLAVGVAASPFGRRIVDELPLAALIGFHSFRIPVEFVLWRLHREGVIPVQMSFEGRNFDVISGITALGLAIAATRGRLPTWLIAAWSLLGLGLLANIVQIAFRSAPGPLRAYDGIPNLLPVTFPWIWLPTFLVASAIAGHGLVIRHLATRSSS
jgi:hypothetical protein